MRRLIGNRAPRQGRLCINDWGSLLKPSVSTCDAAQSVFFALATKDNLTGMVFLIDLKLDIVAYSLDLPTLPLSPTDEIANKQSLKARDQTSLTR
jgi:hypothetical protein